MEFFNEANQVGVNPAIVNGGKPGGETFGLSI
jgi:hypothetical protein